MIKVFTPFLLTPNSPPLFPYFCSLCIITFKFKKMEEEWVRGVGLVLYPEPAIMAKQMAL